MQEEIPYKSSHLDKLEASGYLVLRALKYLLLSVESLLPPLVHLTAAPSSELSLDVNVFPPHPTPSLTFRCPFSIFPNALCLPSARESL